MEVVSKKRGKISRNDVVVAGSIWENRMRFDEFKGGINVYSKKEDTPQVENDEMISGVKTNQVQVDKKLEIGSKTNLDVGSFVMSGKRKIWKSESNFEGNPIQISRKRSELCKELSVSAMKKSPNQSKKKEGNEKMSELRKVKNVSPNGNLRNSLQLVKAKSEKCKDFDGNSKNYDVIEENKVVVDDSKKNLERVFGGSNDESEENKVVDVLDESKKNLERVFSESSDGNEEVDVLDESKKNLERVFSESSDGNDEVDESKKNLERVFCGSSDVIEENKVVLDESKKNLERVFGESSDGNEENKIVNVLDESKNNLERVFGKSSDGNEKNKVVDVLDESKKNLEMVFSELSDGNEDNKVVVDDVLDESKKNLDGNKGNQIKLRKVKSEAENVEGKNEKNCDLRKVKSMCLNGNLRNSLQIVKTKSDKCNKSFEENKVLDESKNKNLEGSFEIQEKLNLENKDFKILEEEINLAEKINKTKKIVIVEEKKIDISNNEKRAMPISPIIKKQSLASFSGQSRIHHHHQSPSRTKPVPASDEFQRNIPRQHSKLESLVDLVMWTDASKSALIFGIGTFFIISSSYTKDLNISFISVISYLGLIYLATIFLFRSLRGANDISESSEYVLGEEEAMWILKLILPYINECLMKIRALFSGDPTTTMKMAVLLFILARCGSSITIWKMSKLGFFGVFIIPKVCSSYSTLLTAYGTFWIRRFRDAWETCTHKKAVAFAIFTLIWNLSSISARIWAVFMLYVGFRYYQQKMIKEGWVDEEEITKSEDYWQGKIERQKRIGRKSTLMESKKQKKAFLKRKKKRRELINILEI